MKKTILSLVISTLAMNLSICQVNNLELMWETDSLLTTVESVIYNEQNGFIYSSNIEGSPGNKDGIGSISQLDIKGNIVVRDWIKGLNAPKGMDIHNGTLYVTDIDQLHEINIENGEIIKSYDIEGAAFLNDVAISKDGTVYFSDTDKGKIFCLKDGIVELFMEFDSPNGLYVEDDRLLVVSWGNKTFNRVDISTKSIEQISNDIINPDGIESIGDGNYFVSSWKGLVHVVNNDGSKKLILDTSEDKIFAADIDYIIEKKILLVPSFFHNTIMAYKYSK